MKYTTYSEVKSSLIFKYKAYLKKILILNKSINFIGNICNLNFNIFIKTIKIDNISKKLEIYKNKKSNTFKISSFLKIIQNIFQKYNIQF
jgi:hypothetical protein